MEISCAFPTTLDSPDRIKVAEELGYQRAWLYDTPQQSPDVWATLALAAERTERIALGPGVLIPTLRHPMVNAAATAQLAAMAPGRVVVGFGTGFTGRRAMGYGAIRWAYMRKYIEAFRALLRGDTIEWEGARMRMLHPAGSGTPRPVDVPIIIGALGPKGRAIAHELGDGIFATLDMADGAEEFGWVSYLYWGTVRDDSEAPGSSRERLAAGPGWALAYHGAYEFGGPDAVRELPGGDAWMAVIEKHPTGEHHLGVHVGHCITLNEADEAAWDAGGSVLVDQVTVTGTADQVRRRLDDLAGRGITEAVYQPAGPDINGELERMIAAARR